MKLIISNCIRYEFNRYESSIARTLIESKPPIIALSIYNLIILYTR